MRGVRLLGAKGLFSERGKPGRVPYTRQHAARLERKGLFPQRVQLGGGGRVGWIEAEIDEYIANLPRGPLPFRGDRHVPGTPPESDRPRRERRRLNPQNA